MVGKGRGGTCRADMASRLGFLEHEVIAWVLVLPIRAVSSQNGAVVASWCGAMATGINSGVARLGEGSGVP